MYFTELKALTSVTAKK